MSPGVPQTNSSSRSLTSCVWVIPKCRAASSSPTPWRCSSHGTIASSRDRRSAEAAVTRCSPPCSPPPPGAPPIPGRTRPARRAAPGPRVRAGPAAPPPRRPARIRPAPGPVRGRRGRRRGRRPSAVPAPGSLGWAVRLDRDRPLAQQHRPAGAHPHQCHPLVGGLGARQHQLPRLEVRRDLVAAGRAHPLHRALDPGQPERAPGGPVAVVADDVPVPRAAGEHPRLDPPARRRAVRRPVGEGDRGPVAGGGVERLERGLRRPHPRLHPDQRLVVRLHAERLELDQRAGRRTGEARLLPDPAGEPQDRQLLAR